MPVKRVEPKEAAQLLAHGYKLVDVRSIPEFQAGHPAGAYNIPLNHMMQGRGMVPNPDFDAAMAKHFAPGDKLILACGSGPRSVRAAERLAAAGYTDVIDMRGGFGGERDPFGRVSVAGWKDSGLPVETDAPGRGWDDLK